MLTSLSVLNGLVTGATERKVVKIGYKCMSDTDNKVLHSRAIQPIRWEVGHFGVVQIMSWDLDKHDWRKYIVDNIIALVVTKDDWKHDIEHQIYNPPDGIPFLVGLHRIHVLPSGEPFHI
jgi:hypothetical protein